jgi:hypothetical protein
MFLVFLEEINWISLYAAETGKYTSRMLVSSIAKADIIIILDSSAVKVGMRRI